MTSSSTSSLSLPTPYSFAPSQYWDGNDGSWSSFIIRVGTPAQDFKVFPSTIGQETLVPIPEGCTDDDPSNCGSLRGVLPFQGTQGTGFLTNESSTWDYIGLYTTNLETNLGIDANGLYGFDTVGLQVDNSGGVTQTEQVVAGVSDKSFMYGVFGLGPRPSNFSVFSDPKPSFLTTLKDNGTIPSKSYGYTAGASYRYSKVTASLTLGGYDVSRFESGGLVFPFSSDDSAPLQVGVTQILASKTLLDSPMTMTSDGYFALVDSTVPHIWMPRAACDNFATAFGLEYDNDTDLYLVNSTTHTKLTDLGASIIFTLSQSIDDGGTNMNIELPYSAFDLEASYPYYENSTRYFPIRRAANDTQYILGRTFLQEAYLIADYERQNFTLAQANFSNPMPDTNLISIPPLGYNSSDHTNSTNSGSIADMHYTSMDRSEIAGIAVGAAAGAGAVLLAGAIWLYIKHRRRKHLHAIPTVDPDTPESPPSFAKVDVLGKMELSGGSEAALSEMPACRGMEKLQGRVEMFSPPPELDGRAKRVGVEQRVFELEGSGVERGGFDRRRFSFET